VRTTEHIAKSASIPKAGLFATLRGLPRAQGIGAPSSATQLGHVSTIGRRLVLAGVASVCALAYILALGAGSAVAATTQFGERGEHSGQFNGPGGVAINQASGDVYVGDRGNFRIDKFEGSGSWLMAWGWHVNEESPAEELQTCTTLCQHGQSGSGAGTYASEGSRGVAVDNEPDLSRGDVYVVDWENFRVQKFGPNGEFILMFGREVNENKSDVCLAGEKCQAGVAGTADGQFNWAYEGSYIAVGPGGKVYVGDKGRVQIFESSGAWKENISLAGLTHEEEGEVVEAQPTALAVDSPGGDVFLTTRGVEGVREFEPSGKEKSTQFDKESLSVAALAVDESGDLYVGDSSGGFHILKYDPAGKELATFGSNTIESSRAMAFANTPGEVYVAGSAIETSEFRVFVFTPPPPGPVIDSESGSPGLKGTAKLEAQINPQGNEATYHFEYVDQTHFQESGYASATSTTPVSIAEGLFEDHSTGAELTGLIPGETYHWRVVATDSLAHTATGADQILEATPSALIDGPWAEDVASTSATLAAKINPLGANTSYRLEYGTSASYGLVFSGSVGEGMSPIAISRHIQELEPGTIYHFRLVTVNEVGTVHGGDHTFTTSTSGSQSVLADHRAWELVSPAVTGGSVFHLAQSGIQAASDGGAITYPVGGAPLGEGIESNTVLLGSQVLSRRTAGGWRPQDISPPQAPPLGGEGEGTGGLILSTAVFSRFSSDLATVALEPPTFTPLDAQGLEGTPYLRSNVAGSVVPLLTAANTPAGTELEPVEELGIRTRLVKIAGGTGDNILLKSQLKLTPEAVATVKGGDNLYEWTAGQLGLVNVLPNNEPSHDNVPAFFAGEGGTAARVISNDGRLIAWTRGTPYHERVEQTKGLYLRDMVERRTVQLGGQAALYQTMSSDGSRVFFLEKGDLYEYDARTGTQTDLTATHGEGETSAGVQESVSNVSEDGSDVYFVAKGKLAEGATGGEDNLYLLHESGGSWATSYIATLSPGDSHSWHSTTQGEPILRGVESRVSPDGRYLAFMSQRSLTGYDNIDQSERRTEEEVDGKTVSTTRHQDEEVFLYDSASGHLDCASCDPTGARPRGLFTGPGTNDQLVEPVGGPGWGQAPHWLGGSLSLWQGELNRDVAQQPRYLSNSGRLFFNSPEPLVPQDTNGLEDVYQYEPPGIGSCTGASSTFSARSGGCVNLISSGTSGAESAFFDASETGDDVFFITSDHLTAADQDTGYDVWDAHVCSASSPCLSASVSPPPCSSGDSCKAAPASQPELFGPAPSATFSGAGNVPPVPPVTSKPLTRAQKLARALRACKKERKKARPACVRRAKRAYGPAHRAKKSTRRGK
jgi:DNA-binding beta-propeller fold protein YncE